MPYKPEAVDNLIVHVIRQAVCEACHHTINDTEMKYTRQAQEWLQDGAHEWARAMGLTQFSDLLDNLESRGWRK